MFRKVLFLAALLPCTTVIGGERPESGYEGQALEAATFTIEDSRAYVGIAAVKLTVGVLRQEDGNLVGDYTIRVPMMTSKNDTGRIVLPVNVSLEELGRKGGVLRGTAYSDDPEAAPLGIVCEIRPHDDSAVLLAITTPDRTLNFESRFRVKTEGASGTRGL